MRGFLGVFFNYKDKSPYIKPHNEMFEPYINFLRNC